jgi:hypothetical protein
LNDWWLVVTHIIYSREGKHHEEKLQEFVVFRAPGRRQQAMMNAP